MTSEQTEHTLQPTLVVPVSVKLNARPPEVAIALLALEAKLTTGQGNADQIWPPVHIDLRPGMRVTSVPWGSPDNIIEIRFPLTLALIEHLERLRHAQGENLGLRVSFSTSAAWLQHTYKELAPNKPPDTSTPFEPRYGIMADLTMFWTSQVQDLLFTVNQSTWVEKVLHGAPVGSLSCATTARTSTPAPSAGCGPASTRHRATTGLARDLTILTYRRIDLVTRDG